MGQGVRTDLGHGASPVSYRHNCLVWNLFSNFQAYLIFTPPSGSGEGLIVLPLFVRMYIHPSQFVVLFLSMQPFVQYLM